MDEMTAQMLKELLKQMGTNQRNAIFSLPAFSSFVTAMDLPNLSEKEMASAIPYEARQYVPIPLSEVVLDWQVLNSLPGVDTNRTQVLLIAVPQEVVNKYYRIAQLAGLNLKSLELESVSLARAFAASDPTPSIVIDMGSRATSITVVDEKSVRMSHEIDTAGNDLTLAVSRGLNVGAATAEQMKKDRGLTVTADVQYLPSLMTPLLDVVVSEVNKVRQRYVDKTRREIKRVILTGAGILPPGIRDYFAQELQLETIMGNSFSRVSYDLELKPLERELCGYLSVAIGAGLKHF
jgi:type IV pilus assembly protein PilM